jgi:hypothetical protein
MPISYTKPPNSFESEGLEGSAPDWTEKIQTVDGAVGDSDWTDEIAGADDKCKIER